MSSDANIPRTAVPYGITDPVEAARAELKAALSAIEEKVNVPKQVGKATTKVKTYAESKPGVVIVAVVGVAVATGLVVWGIARSLSR